jgi:hypothetical protein
MRILLLFIASLHLGCDAYHPVQGMIRDNKGKPVEEAVIEVLHGDRVLSSWQTDKNGRYEFGVTDSPFVRCNSLMIRGRKNGYREVIREMRCGQEIDLVLGKE